MAPLVEHLDAALGSLAAGVAGSVHSMPTRGVAPAADPGKLECT